jgi:hypothetical protein
LTNWKGQDRRLYGSHHSEEVCDAVQLIGYGSATH